jgi:hypothetical protein
MKHKYTQFTGGPTIVTVEVSLGELLGLQESLNSAAEVMDYGPVEEVLAYRQLANITGVIEEAKAHRDNFTV